MTETADDAEILPQQEKRPAMTTGGFVWVSVSFGGGVRGVVVKGEDVRRRRIQVFCIFKF